MFGKLCLMLQLLRLPLNDTFTVASLLRLGWKPRIVQKRVKGQGGLHKAFVKIIKWLEQLWNTNTNTFEEVSFLLPEVIRCRYSKCRINAIRNSFETDRNVPRIIIIQDVPFKPPVLFTLKYVRRKRGGLSGCVTPCWPWWWDFLNRANKWFIFNFNPDFTKCFISPSPIHTQSISIFYILYLLHTEILCSHSYTNQRTKVFNSSIKCFFYFLFWKITLISFLE